jgi:hypothetical protein
MRILLALALLTAACGSKKAPQSPANTTTEAAPEKEEATGATDEAMPTDADEAPGTAADPCAGGE